MILKEDFQSPFFEAIFANAPLGIAFFNSKKQFNKVNAVLATLSGKSPKQLVGKRINDVLPGTAKIIEPLIQQVLDTLEPVTDIELEKFISNNQFDIKFWSANFYPVKSNEGKNLGVLMIVHDITREKQSEEKIRNFAYYDVLTDLPNRAFLEEKLELLVQGARKDTKFFAVVFLDLNRFKVINDSLGHGVGDLILKEVAIRLRNLINSKDIVARLGGDKFIMVLTSIKKRDDATIIARQIFKAFRAPFNIVNHQLYVRASIGMSFYPDDGTDCETLFKNADSALFKAKQLGGFSYQLYTNSMNKLSTQRLEMENMLRQAVRFDELNTFYQPIFSLETGELIACEALVRWNHPQLGIISPDDFIALAEETGLIVPLGYKVLKQACGQIKKWEELFSSKLEISVNVSPYQFQQQNLVEVISKILRETNLEPSSLQLEITESIAADKTDFFINIIRELKQTGIKIAIDDFGTGYSSLSSLQKFPIDTLKIDRSFVRGCITSHHDAAIVSTMVLMAHNLGLTVVAEGVETEKQLEFLTNIGCDQVQGFLFNIPMEPSQLEKLVRVSHNIYKGQHDTPSQRFPTL